MILGVDLAAQQSGFTAGTGLSVVQLQSTAGKHGDVIQVASARTTTPTSPKTTVATPATTPTAGTNGGGQPFPSMPTPVPGGAGAHGQGVEHEKAEGVILETM